MKDVKIELLGMGIILFGLALSTNNFWAYSLGALGITIMLLASLWKGGEK